MLPDYYAHDCVFMIPNEVESTEGGWKTVWDRGESFKNRMLITNTSEGTKAEKIEIDTSYGGFIDKDVPLRYGDYFKDDDTGHTYRVTSDPDTESAPECASFQWKHFTAEREELPE